MDILIVALKRDEVTLASFRPRKHGVSFLAAERHPLTGGEGELARILEGAAPAAGERRVVLALPASLLFMRELELPLTDRAKVRELLPLELKGETALDTDELSFDALQLLNGRFLAVWGKARDLAAQIELLKGAGLEPELVTASLFHWEKLVPAAGTVAVTDGEALAVYRDGNPLYFRALQPGSGAEELSRTVAALELSQGVRVDRVISYARSTGEAEALAQGSRGLAEAKGDGVTGIYETEVDGPEVRLKGEARSFQAANDFKGRVGKVLDGAEVSEIKSRPDGSVSFSCRGKIKGVAQ